MKSIIQITVLILLIQSNIGDTTSIFSIIGSTLSNIISKVSNETTTALSDLVSTLNATFEGLTDELDSIFNTTVSSALNLTNLAESFITSELNNVSNANIEKLVTTLNATIQSFNVTSFLENHASNISGDGLLNFTGLADKYVGGAEEYDVVTDDGYILKVFRIPGNCSKLVLLSHGVLSSADDFLLRGTTSLIYYLVENGFDVWAINYRGNRYSRRHTTLDPNTDSQFWQYSMHEMGYYDLKAVIDFSLNQTGQTQLSLIGHSEGTSTGFVLTTTRPEYNEKIKVFAAMAPVVYLSDTGITLNTLIHLGPLLVKIFEAFGVQEIAGYYSTTKALIDAVCSIETVGYDLCYKAVAASIVGYGPENLGEGFFHVGLGHYPAGTCVQNLHHYIQVSLSGEFKMYDYGSSVNNEIYGTETPPLYNLQNVTCPVALFVAENDLISGIKEGERIKNELANMVAYITISYKAFTHQDYIWGNNSYDVVYKNVTETIASYV